MIIILLYLVLILKNLCHIEVENGDNDKDDDVI